MSVKTVNILGFVGYEVSVITTPLCHVGQKTSRRSYVNEYGWIPIKFKFHIYSGVMKSSSSSDFFNRLECKSHS